jgi:hypothetical protein
MLAGSHFICLLGLQSSLAFCQWIVIVLLLAFLCCRNWLLACMSLPVGYVLGTGCVFEYFSALGISRVFLLGCDWTFMILLR